MAELWLLLALCAIATYAWRGLGALLSGGVDADSEVFTWISCVAYAMIAGLVARILVLPTGALAETTLLERALGSAAALGAYFWLTRRNLFAGVLAGAAAVWLLKLAG
ncbi:MAG: AzlD domain-containing protein [Burkholderiales bacterium]